MQMRVRLVLTILLLVTFACGQRLMAWQAPASAGDTESELKRIITELMGAVAGGHWEVWERYLDDTSIYNDEEGNTLTKAQLKADFKPLPPGYSGDITPADWHIQLYGDAAVVVHTDLEHEEIFGQKLEARYLTTSTFIRRKEGWRLVATQVHSMLHDPPSISVDARVYERYVGTFQLSPSVTYAVTREGDRLFGQRNGRPKQELLPETESVFFIASAPRSRRVFLPDAKGTVSRMLDRRDGKDLVWTRVAQP